MKCNTCGECMNGDGYTSALVCPNAEDGDTDYLEPDATPTMCDDKYENKSTEENIYE